MIITVQQHAGRFDWERIVRRLIVPPRVKLVALILATHADPDGTRVRPGIPLLAAESNQSEATVKRALSTLHRDLGLLELTRRGGGRGGELRANEYRLTIPADLLERADMLGPDGNRHTVTRVALVIPQADDSEITIVTSQSGPSSVDNPDSQLTQEIPENDFHSSYEAPQSRLKDQYGGLRDHSCDPLPDQTNHQRRPDQDPDPAQPPQGDPRPSKCVHGFPAHIDPATGRPRCVLCRRTGTATGEPDP